MLVDEWNWSCIFRTINNHWMVLFKACSAFSFVFFEKRLTGIPMNDLWMTPSKTCIRIYMIFFFLLFNATFSNISAISWRTVLVVEEAGVPRENHRPWETGKLYHLRLRFECTLFCNLQSRVRTHAVLVIGWYELLGNPTTYLTEPPGP